MLAPVYAYVVAVSMLMVCGLCALALFWAIDHFDPRDVRETPKDRHETVGV